MRIHPAFQRLLTVRHPLSAYTEIMTTTRVPGIIFAIVRMGTKYHMAISSKMKGSATTECQIRATTTFLFRPFFQR